MNCRRFAFIIKHYFQIFMLFFLYCIKPNSCQKYDNYKINYLWKFYVARSNAICSSF